jgi:hypothetical protein
MSGAAKRSSKDIAIGDKFGDWEVINPDAGREAGSRHVRLALCRCKCGKVAKVRAANLTSAGQKRCLECQRQAFRRNDDLIPDGKLRRKWTNCHRNMLDRTADPEHAKFPDYGGRGITVCEEWRSDARAFLAWIVGQVGWDDPGMTLDRKDTDGLYSPENCRLASRRQQQRNRRVTPMVEYAGERMSAADFHERFAPMLSERVVYHHLRKGRPPEWIIERNTHRASKEGLV